MMIDEEIIKSYGITTVFRIRNSDIDIDILIFSIRNLVSSSSINQIYKGLQMLQFEVQCV